MKINNRPYDQFDKMVANSLGVKVEEYLKRMSTLDVEQQDAITSRLISDDDKLIEEGKEMFNDIDEV